MNGGRFIQQCHRRIVSAAHESADPGARVDGVEHSIVDIDLLLDIQIDRADIRVGTVENCPIETTSAAIWDTSRC